MIGRFVRFWGMATYRAAGWPTRDGVIPHVHFWALLRTTNAVVASEQRQSYYPAFLAFARVMGSKEARPILDRALRELDQLANTVT